MDQLQEIGTQVPWMLTNGVYLDALSIIRSSTENELLCGLLCQPCND